MPYCQGSKSANQVWDKETSLGLDREGRYGKLFLKKKCRTVGVLVLAGKEGMIRQIKSEGQNAVGCLSKCRSRINRQFVLAKIRQIGERSQNAVDGRSVVGVRQIWGVRNCRRKP